MYYIIYRVEPANGHDLEEIREIGLFCDYEHIEKIYGFESAEYAEDYYNGVFDNGNLVIRDLIQAVWEDRVFQDDLEEGYRSFLEEGLYEATKEEYQLLFSGISFKDETIDDIYGLRAEINVDIELWNVDDCFGKPENYIQYSNKLDKYGTWIKNGKSKETFEKMESAEKICSNQFQFNLSSINALDITKIKGECTESILFAHEKINRIQNYKAIKKLEWSTQPGVLIDYTYKDINESIMELSIYQDSKQVLQCEEKAFRDFDDQEDLDDELIIDLNDEWPQHEKRAFHVVDDKHILVILPKASDETGIVFVWNAEKRAINHLSNGTNVVDACVYGKYLYTYSEIHYKNITSLAEIRRYDYGSYDLQEEGLLLKRFGIDRDNSAFRGSYYHPFREFSERGSWGDWEELLNVQMVVENGILYVKRILEDYTITALPVDIIDAKMRRREGQPKKDQQKQFEQRKLTEQEKQELRQEILSMYLNLKWVQEYRDKGFSDEQLISRIIVGSFVRDLSKEQMRIYRNMGFSIEQLILTMHRNYFQRTYNYILNNPLYTPYVGIDKKKQQVGSLDSQNYVYGIYINPIWHGDKGCAFIRRFPKGVSVDEILCGHRIGNGSIIIDTRYFLPLEKQISKVRARGDYYFASEDGHLTGFDLEDAKKLKQLYNSLQNACEIREDKKAGEKAYQDLEFIFYHPYNPRAKKK